MSESYSVPILQMRSLRLRDNSALSPCSRGDWLRPGHSSLECQPGSWDDFLLAVSVHHRRVVSSETWSDEIKNDGLERMGWRRGGREVRKGQVRSS